MRCIEGETINILDSFIDDLGQPIMPEEGGIGPEVRLVEADGSIIGEAIAIVGEAIGTWTATFSIPVLELDDEVVVYAEWYLTDSYGLRHKHRQDIIVEPVSVHRPTDVVICMSDSDVTEYYTVLIPTAYREGADVKINLYLNNSLLSRRSVSNDDAQVVRKASNYFELYVPVVGNPLKLEPHSLQIHVQRPNANSYDLYTYKLWATTPQMHICSSLIEDHINKARLQNVIPELEYSPADLCSYMYRGLALFNKLGPRLTAFTGTNMQGILMDAWVTCSCYYALGAQLQAEGALAFDFSGQTVSLNMDRSPTIESALGRIEQVISEQVVNTKKLLARAGINSGDGSVGGGVIDGSRNYGVLGMAFAPTTRLGSGVVNGSKAWNRAHYGIR